MVSTISMVLMYSKLLMHKPDTSQTSFFWRIINGTCSTCNQHMLWARYLMPLKIKMCMQCLFDLMLYIYGKQLRSCQDGQLLNHTVTGQTSLGQFTSIVSILSPVTDNLLFLNQWKREIFFHKRMYWRRWSISGLLLTKLTRYGPGIVHAKYLAHF